MNIYRYDKPVYSKDPDVYGNYPEVGSEEVTMTDDDIIVTYYDHWEATMRLAAPTRPLTPAQCIEDWVELHEAVRVGEKQ